jgi:hypothetical protein
LIRASFLWRDQGNGFAAQTEPKQRYFELDETLRDFNSLRISTRSSATRRIGVGIQIKKLERFVSRCRRPLIFPTNHGHFFAGKLSRHGKGLIARSIVDDDNFFSWP